MKKLFLIFIASLFISAFMFSSNHLRPEREAHDFNVFHLTTFKVQTSTSEDQSPQKPLDSQADIETHRNERISILSFLRDSIWQFVGSILGAIAIAISIAIFVLQRSRKAFGYEIIAETALLSVAKDLEDKIQILFEGDIVKGVHLLILKFSNVGNTPILESDFVSNVTVSFDRTSKVLSAEVTERQPASIDVDLEFDEAEVSLTPSLWNSGDSLTVKILVGEFNGNLNVSERIVGVKDIRLIESGFKPITLLIGLLGWILMAMGIVLSISQEKNIIFFILAAAGYVMMVVPVFYDKKFRETLLGILRLLLKRMT